MLIKDSFLFNALNLFVSLLGYLYSTTDFQGLGFLKFFFFNFKFPVQFKTKF